MGMQKSCAQKADERGLTGLVVVSMSGYVADRNSHESDVLIFPSALRRRGGLSSCCSHERGSLHEFPTSLHNC